MINNKSYDKELLKKIRKSLNLTQTQLANDLNKSKQYICLIENGKKNFTQELIDKIYERYGIDPSSFQNGNQLKYQDSTPIEDVLRSKYNLTNETANTISKCLDSFLHLSKIEQENAEQTIKLITENLTNDTVNIFSEYMTSFLKLSKKEQKYAKEALKLMTELNKYIESK